MNDSRPRLLKKLNIIHADLDQLTVDLYSAALEELDLSISDYLTIRDLVSMTGYNTPEVHALLICMFSAVLDGNICMQVSAEHINKRLRPICPRYKELSKKIIGSINGYPELIYMKNDSPSLFDNPAEQYKPLLLVTGTPSRLYFHKYYIYENKFKETLFTLLGRTDTRLADPETTRHLFRELLNENPLVFNSKPAYVNPEQVLALLIPLLSNFTIISGGPGTGKTTVIVNMLRAFTHLGINADKIRIAAPTGRAAQRIQQSLQNNISTIKHKTTCDQDILTISCETIHRLLQYNPQNHSFYHNKKNRLNADVIIIDEASMIDVLIIGKLLDAVPDNCRLVFLGDRNQLPAVDAGAVFADLVPEQSKLTYSSETYHLLCSILPGEQCDFQLSTQKTHTHDRVIVLQKNYRSCSTIVTTADAFNSGEVPSGLRSIEIPALHNRQAGQNYFQDEGVRLLTAGSTELKANYELQLVLDHWIQYFFSTKHSGQQQSYDRLCSELEQLEGTVPGDTRTDTILNNMFYYIDSARILCPIRGGLYGTRSINNYINHTLSAKSGMTGRNTVFNGSVIMITKNDYIHKLYNGDCGIIIKNKKNGHIAVFKQGSSFVFIPLSHIQNFEPAFAITVHKSQGSEYNSILLIMDKNSKKMLSREILYTAITRAKHNVIMYTIHSVLKQALSNKINRESGLNIIE